MALVETPELVEIHDPVLAHRVSAVRKSRWFSVCPEDRQRALGPGLVFRLFCDTNPRPGVAWWCNNMGVFATLANVDWSREFALRVRAAR